MKQKNRLEFPRKLQPLFHPKRYKVLFGGRGGAKSWGVARALIILAQQRTLRILCTREFQNSISESVHLLLSDQIREMGFEDSFQITDTSIRSRNGSEFFFAGLRRNVSKLKSFEGIDIVWVEEAQTVSKASWDTLIPTIRKEGSEIWITFNPILEDDDTYQRFIQHPPKESILIKINWRDNPWFPSVLKDEKDDLKERDFDSYLNVWEGEPRQSVDGAIYQQQLMEAKEGERILHVPHVKSEGVDTYWDLGKSDGTAIWFGQNIAYEYRFIDYLFEQHKGLNYFFSIMQSKPYMYRNIWLPHDAKQERLGQDRTIEAQVRATFPNANVEIIDGCGTPGSVANGIEAARSIFSQCYFDKEKCSDGIHALRHYHYKKDPQTGKTSKNPEHDWSSHGSDAFRYFAMVVQNLTQTKKKKRTHHNVGWMG